MRTPDSQAEPATGMITARVRRLVVAAYGAGVLALTLAPIRAPRAVSAIPESDKLVHAVLFGLMAALISWSLPGPRRPRLPRAVLLATLFAVAVEVMQLFVPYRSADPLDAVAGLVGAVACAFLLSRAPGTRAR